MSNSHKRSCLTIYSLDGVFPQKLFMLCVGETVPDRDGDVIDRELIFIDIDKSLVDVAPAPASGSRVRRVKRENMPRFGSHWKYRFPATHPSFLPFGSSKTTPAHSPGAKCVSPM